MTATATEKTTPSAPSSTETAEKPKCGKPVAQGTENGQKVAKPCIKDAGHDGDCATRVYTKISTKGLSLNALEADDVPTDVKLDQINERTRTDLETQIDGHVKEKHGQWVAAGRPKLFNEAIAKGCAKRYFVKPEEVDGWRKLLKGSAAYLGVHVRIAAPKKHEDGRMILHWIAVDKGTRDSATAKAETKPEVKAEVKPETPKPGPAKK